MVSHLDPGQIIKRVYDETENRIRVDAEITTTVEGEQEVIISQDDDSIRIGDGTDLFTGSIVGPKIGLDVNIIGGVVSGEFTASGLNLGLKQQVVIVTDVVTKVPVTALTDRNGISVRVWGNSLVYFGNSSVTPSDGYPKRQFEEIVMDIKDGSGVELYAICDTGQSCELRILELA